MSDPDFSMFPLAPKGRLYEDFEVGREDAPRARHHGDTLTAYSEVRETRPAERRRACR